MGKVVDIFTGRPLESTRQTRVARLPEAAPAFVPAKRKRGNETGEHRKYELAKIHIAKSQLAMDDDTYRAMLMGRYGVDSSKLLTSAQRHDLLKHMAQCGFVAKRGKSVERGAVARPARRKDVPATLERDDFGRTPYMEKIEALLAEKGRVEGTDMPWGYAVSILKRQSGGVTTRFEHASLDQLRGVIAALTYDARRKGRYAGTWAR